MKQLGLSFTNISVLATEDDHLSFLAIMVFMLFDGLLYYVLAWYIEEVHPGKYGVAKPWYFPLMPSYWCRQIPTGTIWYHKIPGRRKAMQPKLSEDQQELLCEPPAIVI